MQLPTSFLIRHLLLGTALTCLMVGTMPTAAQAAFDPDAGQEPVTLTPHGARQPAPAPYSLSHVSSAAPLYPERAMAAVSPPPAAPAMVPPPPAPPVVAAKPAQSQIVVASAAASEPPQETGYIAPPPVLAALPTAVATSAKPHAISETPLVSPAVARAGTVPAELPPRVVVTVPVPAEPAAVPYASPDLSPEEKAILRRIPDTLEKPPAGPTRNASIRRVSPEVSALLPKLEKESRYESAGIKISIRRDRLDTPYELTRAYEALMAGDSELAVEIYQTILATEPRNQDALFGLAATYQRAGESDKARLLYVELLKINPQHREGLNNFLLIVSQENPQEALYEMQKLAERNPDFSPLIAQIALLYEKIGEHALARKEMLRAIQLSPENLVYKYNLAVMFDRQNQSADAVALYQLLIDAALRGEAIPVPIAQIQERMNYLHTASSEMVQDS